MIGRLLPAVPFSALLLAAPVTFAQEASDSDTPSARINAASPTLMIGAYVYSSATCPQGSNSTLKWWNGEFFSAGRMNNLYPVYVSPGKFTASAKNWETGQTETVEISTFGQLEFAFDTARYSYCPDETLPVAWRGATPAPALSDPPGLAERYADLFEALDRKVTDVGEREVTKKVVEEALKAFGAVELTEMLVRLGLTPDALADVVAARMEQSVLSIETELAQGVVLTIVSEAGAKAFADMILSLPKVKDLPNEWRAPLYVLAEASALAVVDTVVSIGDIPSNGPLVLVGPVLDRIYDAYEVYEASNGVAEAQTTTLLAIAMGAEATAELAVRFRSERTDRIVEQWKAETLKLVESTFTNDDAHEIAAIIEDAYQTLYYEAMYRTNPQLTQSEVDQVNSIRRLTRLGPSTSSARSPPILHPIDGLVKFLSGRDPVETIREAFLEGTSLSRIADIADYDVGNWHNQDIPNVRLKLGERYRSFEYRSDGSIWSYGRILFDKKYSTDAELHIYLSPSRNYSYVVVRDLDRGGIEVAMTTHGAARSYGGDSTDYRPQIIQPFPSRRTQDYCGRLLDGVAWSQNEGYLAFKCQITEGASELGLINTRSRSFSTYSPTWAVAATPRWTDPNYAAQLRRTKDRWMLWGPDFSTLTVDAGGKANVKFDRQRCATEYSDADCWGGWEETSRPVWESVTLPR